MKKLIIKLFNTFFNENFLKFVIIGIINTIIDISIFEIFKFLGVFYMIAKVISFSCGLISSFFLNTVYNYKIKPTFKKFVIYPVSALPNFIIQMVGIYIMVDIMSIDTSIANVVIMIIAIPITFLVTRYILVGKGSDELESINNNSSL